MSRYSRLVFSSFILVLTLFMLVNPRETVVSATLGFKLWYTTVLPALFPFFVVAELLVSLRFVHYLGVRLEPIMRPVFNLPGSSTLAVVMGFTSGFPVGALLTRQLYEQRLLNGDEAERLVSFTNNCSPLFVVGAVGVGMFGNPIIGYWLAAAHYISNLLVGIILRFTSSPPTSISTGSAHRHTEPYQSQGPETIGKMLGNSIQKAITNILAVGGFIVIFSVLTRMLSVWGIIDIVAQMLVNSFAFLNLTYPLAYGLCMGFFEITLGSQAAVASPALDHFPALITVSCILAFSGLSIIAQVMSIVAGLPVRFWFYIRARILQVILSVTIISVLYALGGGNSISTLAMGRPPIYKVLYAFDAWTLSLVCLMIGAVIILMLLGIAWYQSR
ncbi:MAG: sporulation integral membrane protein YlbJ [Syntrophomonadaceae bacterium]